MEAQMGSVGLRSKMAELEKQAERQQEKMKKKLRS